MTPTRDETGREIDWTEVRSRLARASESLSGASADSPERARAVLDARAEILARVPPRAPSAGEVLELAAFDLAGERYALETRHINQVVRRPEVVPVPGTPDHLAGVANLRGEILAVFDLRRLFGVEGSSASPEGSARLVVLGGERPEFGVLADAVHEVRRLRVEEILDPPASAPASGPGGQYVRGVTADALVVLDGAALLGDDRLIIDQGEDVGV